MKSHLLNLSSQTTILRASSSFPFAAIISKVVYIDLNNKIPEGLLTFARTFSNEAGLTREKQIKNTSYKK